MSKVETYTSPEVSLILSEEHYPIVLATWFGAPTVEAVDFYTEWIKGRAAQAKIDHTQFVIVGDSTGMTERPGPSIRRRMAYSIDALAQEYLEQLLGVVTIVENAFMRAVVTMTVFLTRKKLPVIPVRSLSSALDTAIEMLEKAGVSPPETLRAETYRRPEPPPTS